MFMPAYKVEPKEAYYEGEIEYCAVCDGKIEVDSIEWAGRYAYVAGLGCVCDRTAECKRELDLEELRRSA